eukprot:329285_1
MLCWILYCIILALIIIVCRNCSKIISFCRIATPTALYLWLICSSPIITPIESREIMVGNYYGWNYNRGRATDYGSYQSGSNVQYPFADIHASYGDVLVFKRRDSWP